MKALMNQFPPAAEALQRRNSRIQDSGRFDIGGGGQEWVPNYLYDYDVPPEAPAISIYWRYPSENPFEVPTITWSVL